jgi:purine-nucleoside phosphorylase
LGVWDVFISHASEDKQEVAWPLCNALLEAGFKPWLADQEIRLGDSLRAKIDEGLAQSRYGVVILSPNFFAKRWPQTELNALAARESSGDKVVLPVWHKVEHKDIARWSPMLADRVAVSTNQGMKSVVAQICGVLKRIPAESPRSTRGPLQPGPTRRKTPAKKRSANVFERSNQVAQSLLDKTAVRPKIGLVLGSGLGYYASEFANSTVVSYGEIPHFPAPTSPGHRGNLVVGERNRIPIVALQGRLHLYEGLMPEEVAFPVRVLARMGVRIIILTAAAGILNTAIPMGSLVLVSDHVNLLGANPLTGANDDRLGPRFLDMSRVYSDHFRKLALRVANELAVPLYEGVYVAQPGPCYETPAEIRCMQKLGLDLVGMSVVPEAIAAHHMGIPVLAICFAASYAAGVTIDVLDHEHVLTTTASLQANFFRLLDGIVRGLSDELNSLPS